MLSGGNGYRIYPREAVAMMSKIVVEAEMNMGDFLQRRRDIRKLTIAETICESIAHAAQDLHWRVIAVLPRAAHLPDSSPNCGLKTAILRFGNTPES